MEIYAVCCTARSGSTYLCTLLGATGRLGMPDEYANPAVLDPATYDRPEYFASVVATRSTPNGVFGIKVTPEAYAKFTGYYTPSRHVFLRRRNLDEQAISHYRAALTDVWTRRDGDPEPRRDLEYDYGKIAGFRAYIDELNCEWETTFAERGIVPFPVWYEDLCHAPGAMIAAIADYLDVLIDDTVLVSSECRVMRDGLTREWVERLASDRRLVSVGGSECHSGSGG